MVRFGREKVAHVRRADRPPRARNLGQYEFGWSDSDAAGASARRGISPRSSPTSRPSRTSPSGCSRTASRRLQLFGEADAHLGRRPVAGSTSTTSSTSCAPPRSRPRPGKTCPTTSRTPTRSSASPRPSASASSPASPRSTSPRSSTTRSTRSSRRRASSSWTPTRRCASTPSSSRSTSAPSSRPATTSSPR